ncbi:hypothetical protein GRF59_27770 [Paenibacillus sp. HJL G12]|uniref:Uncharacterized protein n=1 Tax=Paenibacillus dendrobii TaxID=2691084 RepID=A0A7X3IR63_9BACL|nr:hypothetical protein [Paenibacillus dendrobii]
MKRISHSCQDPNSDDFGNLPNELIEVVFDDVSRFFRNHGMYSSFLTKS